MARDYFPCFNSYLKKIERLSDQEVGRLFRALMRYSATAEREELAGREGIAYDFIADDIDRANENYKSMCAKNKQNRHSVDERPRPSTTDDERLRPSTTDDETEKEKENTNTNISSLIRDDIIASIVDAWNSLPDIIPNVTKITNGSTRHKLLAKRIRDYSVDDIIRAIKNIRDSDFLQGGNDRGWTITFDWFIKPENFQKVLDGNYASHPKQTKSTRQAQAWESEVSYDLDSAIWKNGYSVPKLKRKE